MVPIHIILEVLCGGSNPSNDESSRRRTIEYVHLDRMVALIKPYRPSLLFLCTVHSAIVDNHLSVNPQVRAVVRVHKELMLACFLHSNDAVDDGSPIVIRQAGVKGLEGSFVGEVCLLSVNNDIWHHIAHAGHAAHLSFHVIELDTEARHQSNVSRLWKL